LTIQATNSQIDLLCGLMNFLNFAGNPQRRKMHHHADSNTGPDICRARGQVTEMRMKCEWHHRFNLVVQRITFQPAFVESQATVQHLNSQMILFVDHDTVPFALTDRDGTRTIAASQLTTDELT